MPKNAPDIIRRTLDPEHTPELTGDQKNRLAVIAAMPDCDIDYSDAPHRADAVWTKPPIFPGKHNQQRGQADTVTPQETTPSCRTEGVY